MTQTGARVPNKPSLSSDPQWSIRQTVQGTLGNYPPVSYLVGQTVKDVARRFAEMVRGLLENGIVTDPNQCVLLLRSTRALPKSAKPYQEALEQQGFQVL